MAAPLVYYTGTFRPTGADGGDVDVLLCHYFVAFMMKLRDWRVAQVLARCVAFFARDFLLFTDYCHLAVGKVDK